MPALISTHCRSIHSGSLGEFCLRQSSACSDNFEHCAKGLSRPLLVGAQRLCHWTDQCTVNSMRLRGRCTEVPLTFAIPMVILGLPNFVLLVDEPDAVFRYSSR